MKCSSAFVVLPKVLPTLRHIHTTHPLCRLQACSNSVTTASATDKAKLAHTPVLLEPLHTLLPRNLEAVVDCTVGAGGHAVSLLGRHDITQYIGIDKDDIALSLASQALQPYHEQIHLLRGDFRQLSSVLSGVLSSDGADLVLLDVGVSSMQLDDASRGFSFHRNGPLDMRMGKDGPSAADLVNGLGETELEDIIFSLGEERAARRIANAIVTARKAEVIRTTKKLADVVLGVKGWGRRGVHPATLTFQALRIAVNGELDALESGLRQGIEALKPGGRLAVICFHSLEDRIAKKCFREMARVVGGVRIITKRPIMATEEECRVNVRSRSAKLRVVERLQLDEVPILGKVNKYAKKE